MMTPPDSNYDPFSAPAFVPTGTGAPQFSEIVAGLGIPSYLGGGSPPSSTTSSAPPLTPLSAPKKEPLVLTSESVLSTAQGWSLETVEVLKARLSELADNKRYRDILVQKLQQRLAITNPVNDQVLVLLADQVSSEMPFVLESKAELTKLLQNTSEPLSVRRASPDELTQTLRDWYEQLNLSYLNPLAAWANWLNGVVEDEQSNI